MLQHGQMKVFAGHGDCSVLGEFSIVDLCKDKEYGQCIFRTYRDNT